MVPTYFPSLTLFPTRRSSDLTVADPEDQPRARHRHRYPAEDERREDHARARRRGARDRLEEERDERDRAEHGHASEEAGRSEEHTSELQSHSDLACRLLPEKK